MRRIPRKFMVAALATVALLGLAGTALGTGATDNDSQGVAAVNSNRQDAVKFTEATLFAQVTTQDHDNNPVIPDQSAEKVNLDFDDSIKITATDLPTCTVAALEGTNTQQAYNACGNARVGSGQAIARVPGVPAPNNEAEFTVSDFNGDPAVATKPEILLHARSDSLGQTVVVRGIVQNSNDPGGMDGGKEYDVPDAPDVAGDLGALVLFNSMVGREYRDNANKKKFFVSARCDDANKQWNFAYSWTYDDNSTDTDTSIQNCATP